MRKVDLAAYSAQKPRKIRPEKVDLGDLPPIQKASRKPQPQNPHPQTPVQPKGEDEKQPKTVRFSERKSERTEIRTENRSEQLPTKRLSRRYSFEFYDDQITRLKKLKHEAEMEGKKVSLSDMARRALDEYLETK